MAYPVCFDLSGLNASRNAVASQRISPFILRWIDFSFLAFFDRVDLFVRSLFLCK